MTDGPNVNAPASGSYGEETALANLKQSLPVGAMGNPAPPPKGPPAPGGSGGPPLQLGPQGGGTPGKAPGIPSVLTQPPGPPQQPGAITGAPTPDQGRLAFLYAVAQSPQVSPVTREWAQVMIGHLVAPGTAYDLTQLPQFSGGPPQGVQQQMGQVAAQPQPQAPSAPPAPLPQMPGR